MVYVTILLLVIISMVAVVTGNVKIAVGIMMIEDMEGVVGDMVEDDPPRSLTNPRSLHLLVGFQIMLYKGILIESLIN